MNNEEFEKGMNTGSIITIILTCIFFLLYTYMSGIGEDGLYRFCLYNEIPLEECYIPEKPHKGEIKNE